MHCGTLRKTSMVNRRGFESDSMASHFPESLIDTDVEIEFVWVGSLEIESV